MAGGVVESDPSSSLVIHTSLSGGHFWSVFVSRFRSVLSDEPLLLQKNNEHPPQTSVEEQSLLLRRRKRQNYFINRGFACAVRHESRIVSLCEENRWWHIKRITCCRVISLLTHTIWLFTDFDACVYSSVVIVKHGCFKRSHDRQPFTFGIKMTYFKTLGLYVLFVLHVCVR